jgi:HEAT repeat protein
MGDPISMDTNPESLMFALESGDGMIRQKARKLLVVLGRPAVSLLAKALVDSKSNQVRWEAAKALGAIGDSGSIPALVKALGDDDSDVAWLAAAALKKFKKIAWQPVLQALMEDGTDGVVLRQRAHHVFLKQKEDGFNDLLETLRKALESGANRESATVAAFEILKRMKVAT